MHSRASHGVSAKEFGDRMSALGVDASRAVETMKKNPVKKRGRSLTRRGEDSDDSDDGGMAVEGEVRHPPPLGSAATALCSPPTTVVLACALFNLSSHHVKH